MEDSEALTNITLEVGKKYKRTGIVLACGHINVSRDTQDDTEHLHRTVTTHCAKRLINIIFSLAIIEGPP